MGFNKKSDAGPYEGMTGQQQKVSQVIHQQQDEVSIPIHFEQDENSIPLHIEQDENSIPIEQEQIQVIPALNYVDAGHNVDYEQNAFKINEAEGVNFNNKNSAIEVELYNTLTLNSIIPTEIQDDSLFQKDKPYNHITLQMYQYESVTSNCYVDRLEGLNLQNAFSSIGGYLLPRVPTLFPWRFYVDKSAKKKAFGGGQIQIPIIHTGAYAPNKTTIDSTPMNLNRGSNIFINKQTDASTVYGLNAVYSTGSDVATNKMPIVEFTNSEAKTNYNFKGLKLQIRHPSNTKARVLLFLSDARNNNFSMSVLDAGPSAPLHVFQYDVTDDNANINMFSKLAIILIDDIDVAKAEIAAAISGITGSTAEKTGLTYLETMLTRDSNNPGTLKDTGLAFAHTWSQADIYNTQVGYEMYGFYPLYLNSDTVAGKVNCVIYTVLLSLNRFLANNTTFSAIKFQSYNYCYNNDGNIAVDVNTPAALSSCVSVSMSGLTFIFNDVYKISTGFRWLKFGFNTSTAWTMTVGFYCDSWHSAMGLSSPSWHDESISGNIANDISSTIMPLNCSYISESNIDTNKIFDPILSLQKFCTAYECGCSSDSLNSEYEVATILNGTADDLEATVTDTATSGVSIITNKIIPTVNYVICTTGNISQPPGYTFDTPQLYNIIKLSAKFSLTWIKMNKAYDYGYFGVLNTDTNRHYTAHNIYDDKDYNLIFNAMPTINRIQIVTSTQVSIVLLLHVEYENIATGQTIEYNLYITLSQISLLPASIFIKDKAYKDQYVCEQYAIEKNSGQILYKNISCSAVGVSAADTFFADNSISKTFALIEYDDNICLPSSNIGNAQLNISSIMTWPSYSFLSKSIFNIYDTTNFASNTYKLIFVHPVDGVIWAVDDIGEATYEDLTTYTTEAQQIVAALYYSYRLLNINASANNTIGGIGRIPMPGTLSIGSLPSIDRNLKTYAVLPEKVATILNIDNINNLNVLGSEIIPANDKSYTRIGNDVYQSSVIKLVTSTRKTLFDMQGDIYYSGNIFIVSSIGKSSLYMVNENSIPTFIMSISDEIILNPVKINEDLIMIGKKYIHSMQRGVIYEFAAAINNADIKPVNSNGYTLYVFDGSVDETALTTNDGIALATNDMNTGLDESLTVDMYSEDATQIYNIGRKGEIVQIDFVSTSSSTAGMECIKNNCYNNEIIIYNPNTTTAAKVANINYKISPSTTYHTYGYIKSQPMHLVTPENMKASCVGFILLTKGYGTITMKLMDGYNTISTDTVDCNSANTNQYNETYVETGVIPLNYYYYECYITPDTGKSLELHMIKLQITYTGEEYALV